MNTRELLDQLLQSGQAMARQGLDFAARQMDLPAEGPEREAALGNLGKGAAAGGLLALLLGTRTGRSLAGPLLKLGGIAAVGALGYTAWKKWQAGQSGAPEESPAPIHELAGPDAEARAVTLVRAMIAAAKADGHVDQRERDLITDRIATLELPDTERRLLQGEIERDLDATSIAALADSRSAAIEVYLATLLVVGGENPLERRYLDELATALALPWGLVRQLEAEAAAE